MGRRAGWQKHGGVNFDVGFYELCVGMHNNEYWIYQQKFQEPAEVSQNDPSCPKSPHYLGKTETSEIQQIGLVPNMQARNARNTIQNASLPYKKTISCKQ